jgi:GntR family transcriptional regulator/MocR family aminotransferase
LAIEQQCDGRMTVIPSAAGLHLSARLSPSYRAGFIAAKAAERGIGLQPFERYATAEAPPNGFAFGYGLIETRQIDEAIRRLAKLIV